MFEKCLHARPDHASRGDETRYDTESLPSTGCSEETSNKNYLKESPAYRKGEKSSPTDESMGPSSAWRAEKRIEESFPFYPFLKTRTLFPRFAKSQRCLPATSASGRSVRVSIGEAM